MRIGWIGFHMEGLLALRSLLEKGVPIQAVIALRPDRAAKRSGAVDYSPLCRQFEIPLYEVANINDSESLSVLKRLCLDVAFVIGWTQIIRPEALRLAKLGMIGAHASLLPHNRGRAPINWALIKGEKQTGNSLMWLAEGVDTGDLIDQVVIPITSYDTCASLYEKVAESNRDMIISLIPRLLAGERPGRPQSHSGEPGLPGRRPEDGLLNWAMKNTEVYDFVRALTKPYPGAFSFLNGKRLTLWQCALLPEGISFEARPGEVIGQVISPVEAACGQAVACGEGGVLLLELEDESGDTLKGHRLSDQHWEGRVWANEQ